MTDCQLRGRDIIALREEMIDGSEPLLKRGMADERIAETSPTLREVRERFKQELSQLDKKYKTIRAPDIYPVRLSPGLQALKERLERQVAAIEMELAPHPPGDLGES